MCHVEKCTNRIYPEKIVNARLFLLTVGSILINEDFLKQIIAPNDKVYLLHY